MLADAVLNLGLPSFGKALFHSMNQAFSIRQMTVYRFADGQPVEALIAESANEDMLLHRALRRYIGQFNSVDPLRRFFLQSSEDEIAIKRVDATDIADVRFRKELYSSANIAGKLVLIFKQKNHTLSLSLFRGSDVGPFANADIDRIEPWISTIGATLERHAALQKPKEAAQIPQLESLCRLLPSSETFSKREIEVCARSLYGMTADGIAADLDISAHTVVTYRRRIFVKLGINNLNQLFAIALCERNQIQNYQ